MKNTEEYLILVDEQDREVGTSEKQAAHEKALLHRAFSVFIMKGDEVLLQQRQSSKYHCGGLWTNTCCGHPRPNEETKAAAERRLHEELGFAQPLKDVGSFTYRAEFDNGLTEYEFDHVFFAEYDDQTISPNPDEVSAIEWLSVEKLKQRLKKAPEQFTPWLGLALSVLLKARGQK
ncbi:MAG: isopentenyl-diphosphate delta-isomerase [Gammaproteobacteria bacterium CG11_big_fil_rev_8_21_14_0_20_46_22]|nr:MAG: isopentenyl-diphosphate delta-isomerase [Gammaproteobacteria bacterium CG12_big_fil_rev_8_21_14_0_65_46_12]PIR11125.1 MAG: isopentenyl-diphosphate delta-isomerase [Gammaproteobacteria bacterium CG11_big_fil_rev_8_21_14_0_20_46_22]